MEVFIVITVILGFLLVLVALGIVVKLVLDAVLKMSDTKAGKPVVYMLKVSPDGEMKIRKYRGSVNYLSEKNWK